MSIWFRSGTNTQSPDYDVRLRNDLHFDDHLGDKGYTGIRKSRIQGRVLCAHMGVDDYSWDLGRGRVWLLNCQPPWGLGIQLTLSASNPDKQRTGYTQCTVALQACQAMTTDVLRETAPLNWTRSVEKAESGGFDATL
jgi:hypothetical protein